MRKSAIKECISICYSSSEKSDSSRMKGVQLFLVFVILYSLSDVEGAMQPEPQGPPMECK